MRIWPWILGIGVVGVGAVAMARPTQPKPEPIPKVPPAEPTEEPVLEEPTGPAEKVLSQRVVNQSANDRLPAPVTVTVVKSAPGETHPYEVRFQYMNGILRYYHSNLAAANMRASDLMFAKPLAIGCVQEYSKLHNVWVCEGGQQLFTGDIAALGMFDDGVAYKLIRVRVDTSRDKPYIGEHQAPGSQSWQPMGSWTDLDLAIANTKTV